MAADRLEIVPRLAGTADFAALIEFERAVGRIATGDVPKHDYLRKAVAAGECHLATADGAFAGYAVLHYHFFHSGFVDLLIVGPDYRRRGIGSHLIRYLAEICATPKIWISTNLSNTPMQSLLAKEGFVMSGFIEGLDEGDPELFYSRPARGGRQREEGVSC